MKELKYVNFAQYLIENSTRVSNKVAIIDDEQEITYGTLAKFIRSFAYQLREQEIQSGDRVMIYMEDCVEWVVGFLACQYIGAVPVLTSNKLCSKAIEEIKSVTEAKLILTKEKVIVGSYEIDQYHEFARDEIGWWAISSGTSGGKRKYILHRHSSLAKGPEKVTVPYKIHAESIFYSLPKLSFMYGLVNMMLSLANTATSIISNQIPVGETIKNIVKKYKITHLWATPNPLVHMTKNNQKPSDDLKSLKAVVCGGEPLPIAAAERFVRLYNVPILDGFGMSEGVHMMCSQTIDDQRIGTVGKPLIGIECEIRREDGTVADPYEIGVLYVKDPSMASYYHNYTNYVISDPAKETFQDQWIRTNDILYKDPDGYFVYVCRNDDLLKVSGMFISPIEVEQAISAHPQIDECVVVTDKNRLGLDEIVAYVVLKENAVADVKDIKNFLIGRIEDYKIPKLINFVDLIPKTITTKKIRNKQVLQDKVTICG